MDSQWVAPSPRGGMKGWVDRLIGPGATSVEIGLQLVPAVIAMVVAVVYAHASSTSLATGQLALIAFLGFDIAGGVATNATSSAKRWYHRSGQNWRDHLAFVAIHFVHIGLVALFLRGQDWTFFLVVSTYLISAAGLVTSVPLYIQRPVALILYSVALVGDRYFLAPTVGMEWFLSLFFLKLLIGHLLREIPYQPSETVVPDP